MAASKRSLFIVLLSIIGVLFNSDSTPGQQRLLQKSTITEIEDRLLDLVNLARAQHDRMPLRSSSFLKNIARAHSGDMAKGSLLSHISTSGATYTERLEAQGILFGPHGENVAFSQTYTAEFIHQSLMDSPEHRHNILESKFDEVGIGVFFEEDKGYYITQDFIRPLIADLVHVKQQAKKSLDQIRDSLALPSFDFIPDADHLADRYSQSKAKGDALPAMPPKYKAVPIKFIFLTSSSLESVLPDIQSIDHTRYHSGGLGLSLGRDQDHPGGAYFFTFLLIQGTPYRSLKPEEWKNIWLEHVNRARKESHLTPIQVDHLLSQTAEAISIQARKQYPITLPSSLAAYAVRSYQSNDLTHFPENLMQSLTDPSLVEFGLGIRYQPDPELPIGSFWITVIYR